jgi:hypothetical protein
MRSVLFVVDSMGTGKVYRTLAIAEILHKLYPAIRIRFLTGGTAAELLEAADRFPVDARLTTAPPITIGDPSSAENDAGAVLRLRRRLGPMQARNIVAVAREVGAERVIVDGLFHAPPKLRSAGIPVTFLTDQLLEAEAARGTLPRVQAGLLRRAVVGSSDQRFFLGEPSYLGTPELRVWARRYFRFAGPISGLARLHRKECASLRDDLGIRTPRLLVVSGGGLTTCPEPLGAALESSQELLERRRDWSVLFVAGSAFEAPARADRLLTRSLEPELYRLFAVADAALVLGGLTGLVESVGLGLPTLFLPTPGVIENLWHGRYFAGRHGTRLLAPAEQTKEAIDAALAAVLDAPPPGDAQPFDTVEEQRRSAHYVADLIAEILGRRRPGSQSPTAAATPCG